MIITRTLLRASSYLSQTLHHAQAVPWFSKVISINLTSARVTRGEVIAEHFQSCSVGITGGYNVCDDQNATKAKCIHYL